MIFNALLSQLKGFRKYLSDKNFVIHADKKNLQDCEISFIKDFETLHIAPVIEGSKSKIFSGIFKVITGAFLLGLGFFVPPLAPYTLGAGISLFAGGVSQMLSPTPHKPSYDPNDRESSYNFDGPQNISLAGVFMPIVYGTMLVGSNIVSQYIITSDI